MIALLTVGGNWRHYDPGTNKGDPSPQPSNSFFGQYTSDTIAGLGLLRASFADPVHADQYRAQAQSAFDRSRAEFTAAVQAS